MRRTLFEDLHEDFRASFRTFLEREVIGEEGRYGEWERDGDRAARGVRARRRAAASWRWPCPSATAARARRTSASTWSIGEETQRAGVGGFGLGITLHNDICLPYFLTYCTEAQRERWLRRDRLAAS